MDRPIDVIVCGHLCLDLLPSMENVALGQLTMPGHLFEVGGMTLSTGGVVSNTGLALHRLGVNVRLMSTVGNDAIGRLIVAFLESRDPSLTKLLRVKPDSPGSYTVVLSPEKVDRIFLHCTGTNATFNSRDVDYSQLSQAKIFHLGYPPLLPGLLPNDGEELVSLLRQARQTGAIMSLDLTLPDSQSYSGSVNWPTILARALQFVDICIPSIDEILYMLRPQDYADWKGAVLQNVTAPYLDDLADQLLAMSSAAIVGFKLGDHGIYVRGASNERFAALKPLPICADDWADQRVWYPAFQVDVAGTTGAGDSAYAGFLAAMLRGLSMGECAKWACAVGACNVEATDATSGVRTWPETEQRMAAGWANNGERLSGW